MAIEGKNGQLTLFGRISLDRVYDEWESSHHLNPRFLAGEVAATLENLYQFDQTIQPLHACVFSGGKPDRSAVIEYSALIAHFQAASQGQKLTTIGSSAGPVPTTHVLLWRSWIDRISQEAAALAEMAVGCAMPANDSGSVSATANSSPKLSPPLPPSGISGNSPLVLKARQAQLRRSGEKTAGEKLEEVTVERDRAQNELAKEKAAHLTALARVQQTEEENESYRRDNSDKTRLIRELQDDQIRMEELLERSMALAEFMNSDNPLSPPDGRLLVEIWWDQTQRGSTEPTIGWLENISRWLKARGRSLSGKKLRSIASLLTPENRKKGGPIARSKIKG